MSYRQLFLLILTIWSAEICTRVLFDALLPKQMEYRTLYLEKDKDGVYKGSHLKDLGGKGWQLVTALPAPDDREQLVLFFQRQTLISRGE